MLTLAEASEKLNISLNDLKVHIHRGNIATPITQSDIPSIKQSIQDFPIIPIKTNYKKCYWFWHDGVYTSVLDYTKEKAIQQFSKSRANSKKIVYSVWEV